MEMFVKQFHDKAKPLTVATPDSAGFDLAAALDEGQEIVVCPGKTVMVPTGWIMQIPKGFVGMVCPRSGLAYKNSITVANSPGIIDSDYRGEVKVLLVNHGDTPFHIKGGDRIAQLVILPVVTNMINIFKVQELDITLRGEGGFGSTGVSST